MAKDNEVLRSLASGLVAYAMIVACSSGGGDGGKVENTGGVTGMNGNAGESSSGGANGTGAVAMAATGGDTSGTCECPEPEPDVELTVDCDANYQTQLWAELTITGLKATDITRIRYVSFDSGGDTMVGTPGAYTHAASNAIAFKTDTVAVQCWGDKATFVLPADLAAKVVQ